MGFAVLDSLWPKREESVMENRPLAQYPEVSLSSIANNSWMVDYESYVKDQFAFRDTWIDTKSISESVLLKKENNDILFGSDDYLFAKEWHIDDMNRYENNKNALAKFAERHTTNLSVMIVPSSSNILSDKLPAYAPMLDENAYLDEILAQTAAAGANVIDVRDKLLENKDEYIYYMTDHHWTAEGAYIAYEQFATANGLALFNPDNYTAVEVTDFLGTHFSKSRNIDVVPDTMTYYDIENNLSVQQRDGQETTMQDGPVYDYAMFDERDKYAAYLRGNNGYSVLDGDGEGKILVIKDSYANSFIPYLVASYDEIAIVDYRVNLTPIDTLLRETGYEEVLFLYSFDSFISDTYFGSKIVSAS